MHKIFSFNMSGKIHTERERRRRKKTLIHEELITKPFRESTPQRRKGFASCVFSQCLLFLQTTLSILCSNHIFHNNGLRALSQFSLNSNTIQEYSKEIMV